MAMPDDVLLSSNAFKMFADRAVMLVGDLMQIPPVRQQKHGKIYILN